MRAVLEKRERLSGSLLWRLQRAFFNQNGLGAWSEGIVPHYVTSNPRMAAAYARLALGFLQTHSRLSTRQHVYIVELGAGSGRFAYRFLKKLRALQPAHGPRLTYVITDIAERTLDALQAHPSLRPLVEDGSLDFAWFDVEHPCDLELRHAAQRLSADSAAGPLIAIANYVFDGVAQDCFAIRDRTLYECLVTTSVPAGSGADLDDPDLLGQVRLAFAERPVQAERYYEDAACNAVLEGYTEDLPDGVFLFPSRALACLRYLRALSQDRLLVLTADKGVHLPGELTAARYPRLNLHGSFSLPVNYHAFGQWVRGQGGLALEPRHQPTSLRICAYAWGITSRAVPSLSAIYDEAIDQGGPDDFFILKGTLEPYLAKLNLSQLLSYLRLSGWDSDVLMACEARMQTCLADASEAQRADLASALEQVWEGYMPIGEQQDVAFAIGTLLFAAQRVERALSYFERSRMIWGPHPATDHNLELCHKHLGQTA
jgi:hypothetical protein